MKPVALHVGMTGMRVLVGIRGAYFCTVFRKNDHHFLCSVKGSGKAACLAQPHQQK